MEKKPNLFARIKDWFVMNKGAAIMIGITIAYTLIMIGIIYGVWL